MLAWLARHPRWTFPFTPISASWLNAVENFFSMITREHIRRGVFRSIADLQAAINSYLAEHNASPKPFVWTKSAEAILAKLDRCPPIRLIQCTRYNSFTAGIPMAFWDEPARPARAGSSAICPAKPPRSASR